ncbi:MAG: hypothetical protein EXR79_00020 [Myxococcales bacterium]|nr:hypothetical protein [Myxococcales bacterium]
MSPARPPAKEAGALPPAAVAALWVLGLGAVGGGAAWLFLFGGVRTLYRVLPPGVMTVLGGEKPFGETVMPQQASGERPWERQGAAAKADRWADEAAVEPADKAGAAAEGIGKGGAAAEGIGEAGAGSAEAVAEAATEPAVGRAGAAAPVAQTDEQAEAERAMAPVRALSAHAVETVRAYEEDPTDQERYHEADKAVEALRTAVVAADSAALKVAATEFRNELALAGRKSLDLARLSGRATHRVTGTAKRDPVGLDMHKDTKATSKELGRLDDGTLVRVHLDAGGGWVRAEAMTGDQTGLAGYVQARYLRPLKRKKPVD